MITFVTFHVENEEKFNSAIKSKNVPNIYHLIIELMFRSAFLFHSTCKRVMLTDQKTRFDYLDRSIEVRRTDVDSKAPLMFSRLLSQIEFVKKDNGASNLVFLDADILVNENIESVFQEEFDIALTYREMNDMPINWGVMLISKNNREKVIQFLEKVLATYKNKYFTSPIFWCDQYALIDTIGRENFFQRHSDLVDLDGIKIRFLPCDQYNFSPDDNFRSIASELKTRSIIHFKGPRKRFINHYWKAYLAYRERLRLGRLTEAIATRAEILSSAANEVILIKVSPLLNVLRRGKRLLLDSKVN